MSTIIAVQEDTDVGLAWDSRVSRGGNHSSMVESKVFAHGAIVFGLAGSLRFMNLVATTKFPDYDGSDAFSFLVVHVVPVLKQLAQENGLMDEDGAGIPGAGLIVLDGTLFELDSGLSINSVIEGYSQVGSGGEYAHGALLAGASLEEAMQIAGKCDLFTGPPYFSSKYSEMIDD